MININNLIDNLEPGPNAPDEVHCIVEIPRGCSNKYEYNHEVGAFFLDRVLYSSLFYPTEYGCIPQTLCEQDGDPLDIMVFSSFPTFPGCVIRCRPIASESHNMPVERPGELRSRKAAATPDTQAGS